jgi:hypothetical protein
MKVQVFLVETESFTIILTNRIGFREEPQQRVYPLPDFKSFWIALEILLISKIAVPVHRLMV